MFVVRSSSLPDLTLPALKTSTLIDSGQSSLQARNPQAALAYFDQALEQQCGQTDPLADQARMGRAQALFAMHRDAEAMRELEQVHPGASAILHGAQMLEQLGRTQTAETLLHRALHDYPRHIGVLKQLALFMMHREQLDQAFHHVQAGLKIAPLDADLLHLQGSLLCQRGHHQEALPSLCLAVDQQPGNADMLFKYGWALSCVGHHEQAARIFSRALQHNPTHPGVLRHYIKALLRLNHPQVALEVINPALAREPHHTEYLGYQAIALLMTRQFDACLMNCNLQIEVAPHSAQGFNMRGVLHLTREEPQQALPDFEHALELNPNNLRLRLNHARTLLSLGRPQDAIPSLAWSRTLAPDHPELQALSHWFNEQLANELDTPPDSNTPSAHEAVSPRKKRKQKTEQRPSLPPRTRARAAKPPLHPDTLPLQVIESPPAGQLDQLPPGWVRV